MRGVVAGVSLALALGSTALAQDASNMLARLHDALRLTPAEEPAWRQYASAMDGAAQLQARHLSTQRMLPQLQTPRRLALLDASMSQDLADFRRQSDAIKAFYDILTPVQQHTFDRETSPGSAEDAPG